MKASDLKDMDLQELIDQLQSLDMENVGGWPTPVKAVAAVIVLLAVLFGGYMLLISDQNVALDRERSEEAGLLKSYENKAFEAHNLDQFRAQLDEMDQTFGDLLKQLPKQTEVAELLEDVTHTGISSGLIIEGVDLQKEVAKEFYVELPLDIRVVGGYHALGSFVSGVAALSRIVTLHDFTIEKSKGTHADIGALAMKITAKTYRYANEDDAGAGK